MSDENGFEVISESEMAIQSNVEKENTTGSGPAPLPSWINPPQSNLTLPLNLISGPPSLSLPPGQLFPVSSSTPTAGNHQFFTSPPAIGSHPHGLNLPILLPLSPVTENETQLISSTSALEIAVLESPTACSGPAVKAEAVAGDVSSKGGIFGWMKEKAVKVAEKARSSVDTVITTLDPQMKEIIYSGGDIDIAVTSTKELKVSAVREAFQTVFGKATVRGFESQSTSVAAQPVGFASGLLAARERIAHLRNSGTINPQQPVLSVEGFVVELFDNNWFEMNCLLLEDPVRKISIQTFSQPVMIPTSAVARMRNSTTDSYSFKSSGFAVTVGQAVADELNVSPTEWQAALTGISRREVLLLAAKTLANAYKA